MSGRCVWLAILIVLALLGRGVVPASARGEETHTRVELRASVDAVRPGVPFTVGIRLTMDPGWHTYWRNPGESGLPTVILWDLPSGFSAGDIQWPIPGKKIESGDLLTFGYSGTATLLVDLRPPPVLDENTPVRLRAVVEWLECEQTCIPGSDTVELTLPVRLQASPANEQFFSAARARLPFGTDQGAGIVLAVRPEPGELVLEVSPKEGEPPLLRTGETPDFFPYPDPTITVGRTRRDADGGIRVPVRPVDTTRTPETLRGIVVYRLESGDTRAVEYAIPIPPSVWASARAEGGILDREFATQAAGDQTPLVLYLLFAVIGGLLLNIMPCVLPVIALKIFGLVKMAGDNPARVRRLGWFFALGVLVSFLVLALLVIVLKVAGQQVGWGFQFQEPLFVIAMCAVVFAFGLSLFGVYEFRVPGSATSSVSTAIAGSAARGKGEAASFLEGVFATILATPCTAPFLGAALGFAFVQPVPIILLIFTMVAVGMALPYLILTMRPAWMKFLPRPGEWMEGVKQFMGFLMMATLLWLLYVLGKQLGMEALIWTGAFLLMVAVALWVVGRFATLTASRGRTYAAWVIAAAVVVGGYWYFIEHTLDIHALVAGEIAPTATASDAGNSGGIAWEPFSLAGLETHLQSGAPVFVDFTAEWCLTCKVNEKTVLADNAVVEKFASMGIVTIKADWTTRNPDITRLLQKFGRSGVPLYVLFPAGRPSEPIVLPEVITSGIVLDALESAR